MNNPQIRLINSDSGPRPYISSFSVYLFILIGTLFPSRIGTSSYPQLAFFPAHREELSRKDSSPNKGPHPISPKKEGRPITK
nr:hypothetical protein Q903MT_gene495 [Picea sitchensis]